MPDPATSIPLFRSARYSSYTFAPVKSGTDIIVKIYPGTNARFCLLHWSERPGEMNECVAIPEECAVILLRELAAMPDPLTGMELANIRHHLPAYFRKRPRSLDVVSVLQDDTSGLSIRYNRKPPDVV